MGERQEGELERPVRVARVRGSVVKIRPQRLAEATGRAIDQPSEAVMSARFMLAHIPTAQILWLGPCLFVFLPETLEFLTVHLLHSQLLRALRRSCTFPF